MTAPAVRQCRGNRVFVEARTAAGMTQVQLARLALDTDQSLYPGSTPKTLEAVVRTINRIETGSTHRPRQWYVDALSRALDRSPETLFGVSPQPTSDRDAATRFELTSHKFVPVNVGADAAAQVATDPHMVPEQCEWLPVHRMPVPIPGADCTVTVFSFGVLLFHIIEAGPFPSIGELAVWRKASELERHEDVAAFIQQRWPGTLSEPSHTFHAYWVDRAGWDSADLDTALRMLCHSSTLMPRRASGLGLDERVAHAEAAENERFAHGVDEQGMHAVGSSGVSVAYVCWAGLSYLPLASDRAVRQDEMASVETVVQALWCYCHAITDAVMQQHDPQVPDDYGRAFLHACLRRLTKPAPNDTGKLLTLKEGILDTSRIVGMLQDAITDLT